MADPPRDHATGDNAVETAQGLFSGTSRWQKVVGILGLVVVLPHLAKGEEALLADRKRVLAHGVAEHGSYQTLGVLLYPLALRRR
jgi:hypothetical protein